MKNREIILWTVIIALVGAIILYFAINGNSSQNIPKITNKNKATIPTILSYTLADVSKHNNETSCWTIIDGKIYDITSYIYSHPAGVNKIMQGCGIDSTRMYGRVGAHDVARLANTFVGNLK